MFTIHEAVELPYRKIYSTVDGGHSFGIPDTRRATTWRSCREQTRRLIVSNKPNHLWFEFNHNAFSPNFTTSAWNVARWFYYIEGRMGWHERTVFNWVHNQQMLRVTPAAVWYRDHITISLFTLMLRVGLKCSEGTSLEENLHRDPYCLDTLSAIHRFLQGYNLYIGNSFFGWHATFNNLHWNSICRLLVKYEDVKNLAYHLWETSGRPENANPNHYWNQAKINLRAQVQNAA